MRYVLIDYMPLVYKYSVVTAPMSHTTTVNGVVRTFDTTIPSCTIKHIVRCGGYGDYKVAVCFDGGSEFRKQHFANCTALNVNTTEPLEYKGGRKKLHGTLKEGADITVNLLVQGGVTCYRKYGYEADDYLFTLVQELKEHGVTDPIDIVTVDRDLLPLVDDQVSVYIDSKRQFNDIGSPTLKGYFQVTPRSMEQFCALSSAYKNYKLPYNSILLFKIIKGDKSDNIPMAVKGYGGKAFTKLVDQMITDGVQFDKVFRYGKDFATEMAPILTRYFNEVDLARMEEVYTGLNLRRVIPDNGESFTVMPQCINELQLQDSVARLNIQLPHRKYNT